MLSGIKAVLVDIDGTVLDSNEAHAQSWVDALAAHGFPVAYDRIRSLIGKGGDKLLAETVGVDDDSELGTRIADLRRTIFEEKHLRSLEPTPGARDLLVFLRRHDIQVIVATSAGSDDVDALLKQAGVDDLVDAIVTSEDAEASKPDPDIVQAALEKAGVAAHEAVMIGDTPFDIEAAAKAGIRSIALRCGGWWADDELDGASEIFDDPLALTHAMTAPAG